MKRLTVETILLFMVNVFAVCEWKHPFGLFISRFCLPYSIRMNNPPVIFVTLHSRVENLRLFWWSLATSLLDQQALVLKNHIQPNVDLNSRQILHEQVLTVYCCWNNRRKTCQQYSQLSSRSQACDDENQKLENRNSQRCRIFYIERRVRHLTDLYLVS